MLATRLVTTDRTITGVCRLSTVSSGTLDHPNSVTAVGNGCSCQLTEICWVSSSTPGAPHEKRI